MYSGHMDGWGWGGWLAATVMMLILFGGLAAIVIAIVRRPAGVSQETPERILSERFARGEIDEDEYQRRRRTLRG
jgi:putative membrane protein